MNIKEYDNNIVIKERTNIEKYLLRIIQRYFDIENNYTKESIEEMIMESLTRFKQFITIEKGFIFSLNKKTGNLILSVSDFGGQPRFNKKTAYNKNFGTTANTITRGNDPRLSNARAPVFHNHAIGHVDDLIELLKPAESAAEIDVHPNEKVINMLKYTGSKLEVDLIFLEYLENSINQYYANLEFYEREVVAILTHTIETVNNLLIEVKNYFDVIQDIAKNNINWLPAAKEYTNKQISLYKNFFDRVIVESLTQEDIDTLSNILKSSYRVIVDGEIPLTDGIVSCVPIMESEIIEAGSEEGDALRKIFDEGTKVLSPNDALYYPGTWVWDDINNSFVYPYNEQNCYTMFISLSKFETYTHRVTFKADDPDEDVISTVIAYDEETKSHLSLVVTPGGVGFSGVTGATASILLNYQDDYSLNNFMSYGRTPVGNACYKLLGPFSRWNNLTNGVTVLVKKEKNNIKAWVNYNTPNTWQPETINGIKNIYPTTEPDFELNLEDHSTLSCFLNKRNNYGYGCYSQANSTYRDVYIIGESFSSVTGSTGHVNIKETNEATYTVPSSIISTVANSKIKMFFKYDLEDGTVITTPLPYSFLDRDGINVVVQGSYTDTGKINIQSNFIDKVPKLYASNFVIYQNQYIIGCCKYAQTDIAQLNTNGVKLVKIESNDKNNFVKNIIPDENLYRIQGTSLKGEGMYPSSNYVFDNRTVMSYFNWNITLKNDILPFIAIDKNGSWASVDGNSNNLFVLEYKAKRLSDYFINPRVYYQVLGNEG